MSVKLTGFAEIDKVLKGLSKQLTDQVLQSAHAQALKITIDQAKLLAPEGPTGGLIDSIGTTKAPRKSLNRRELGAVSGGPRRGKFKGFHGHLVEYGTKSRKTRAGWNRGTMPKKPFMLPAWEQTSSRVQASINTEIGKSLYRFMKKTIKK